MDILRNCWNQHSTPDIFFQKILECNKDEIFKVILFLIHSCAELSLSPSIQLFAQYLKIFFQKYEEGFQLYQSFDQNDSLFILGSVNFFNFGGESLFSNMEIGDELSARICLKILTICFQCPNRDLVNSAIRKLARSLTFSSNIAAGRIYDMSSVKWIRSKWYEYHPFEDLFQPLPAALCHFQDALLSDSLIQTQFMTFDIPSFVFFSAPLLFSNSFLELPKKTSVLNIISEQINHSQEILNHEENYMIREIEKNSSSDEEPTSNSPNKQFFQKLYSGIISEFIRHSSLFNGYVIVNGIFRIKNPHMSPVEFDQETFTQVLTNLYFSSEIPSPEGLSLEEALAIFTTVPKAIPNENLIEYALQYPALTPSLGTRLISILKNKPSKSSNSIIKALLRIGEDFWLIIYISQQLDPFLDALMNYLFTLNEHEYFDVAWYLYLSLIRNPWRLGISKIRIHIEKYVKTTAEPLQHYLLALLNIPSAPRQVSKDEFLNSQNSLLLHVVNFYDYLCSLSLKENLISEDDTQNNLNTLNDQNEYIFDINKVIEMLDDEPVLWTSVLLWAIDHLSQSQWLSQLKPPDSPITQFLFEKYMILCSQNDFHWIQAFDLQDYDLLISFISIDQIHSTSLIHITISHGLCQINSKHYIFSVITTWSALISSMGLSNFLKELFRTIISSFPHDSIYVLRYIFQTAAIPFFAVCEERSEYIPIIIAVIEELLNTASPSLFKQIGEGLTNFVLVLIILWKELQELLIPKLLGVCKIFQDKPSWTIFVHQFIKFALYTPKLANLLPYEVFEVLKATHDWVTLIDFFIYHGSIKFHDEQ